MNGEGKISRAGADQGDGDPREVSVRPAVAADRGAVLDFCANTWPGGDYIPYVWEDWLNDARGRLLAADLGGRAVGIAHVQRLADGSAWLEGLRVDPAVRRRGIARLLTQASLDAARELAGRGAIARLMVSERNAVSRHLVERSGFRLERRSWLMEREAVNDGGAPADEHSSAAEAARALGAPRREDEPPQEDPLAGLELARVPEAEAARLAGLLRDDPPASLLPVRPGLVWEWAWVSLHPAGLTDLAGQGVLWTARRRGMLAAVAALGRSGPDDDLLLAPLAGTALLLAALARGWPGAGAPQWLSILDTPEDGELARRAGFHAGNRSHGQLIYAQVL
ncbi:GNAT family N-acetyltransferase [Limnochorda pilosa]|uniref:N-acetyltransferase domain-containing protein n=1 Tax=Limnochorda pilosa TaxID=1555112 RepID=A0A0K2SIE3_LIMPI|nr:GNAT family N-acetyltransferase [Limnochorda pilosa]BAS26609.1 hypothetical protein LIP_0752 [Limnochorda pilosa]